MATFDKYLRSLSELLNTAHELGFTAQSVANDLVVLEKVPGKATYLKALALLGAASGAKKKLNVKL